MLVILDAWLELADWVNSAIVDFHQAKFSLALGKDPLNTAVLLPVAKVSNAILDAGAGATDQPITGVSPVVEQLFKARGWMGAAQAVAIDFIESGSVDITADLHVDWTVAGVDWWTWFVSWNNLEASPDGNLVDGQKFYD